LKSCVLNFFPAVASPNTQNAALSKTRGSLSAGRRNPKKSLDQLHKQLLQKLILDLDKAEASSSFPDFLNHRSISTPVKENNSSKIALPISTIAALENIVVPENTLTFEKNDMLVKVEANIQQGSSAQTDSKQMASPVVRKTEKGLYPCAVSECVRAFNHEKDFLQHTNTEHSSLDVLPCPFCLDELSARTDALCIHLKTHVRNLVRCSYCAVMCDSTEELSPHMNAVHHGQPKKFNVCVKIMNNERRKLEKVCMVGKIE